MSARADPLRNTLDHLALDPKAKDDRRYLISMLRRLGYTDKEIDIALGEHRAVEIEYSRNESSSGFTVVEESEPEHEWPETDAPSGLGFSVTRGSVAPPGGDPAVEFGWRPVENSDVHLPVDVDEEWESKEEIHEGPVEFVERDDWVEADDDVEEGDQVEWVSADELELSDDDEVEWEEAAPAAEPEETVEWVDESELDENGDLIEDHGTVSRVAMKDDDGAYLPPPKHGGSGPALDDEDVPPDYIVSEPPGRVWDKEDEEEETTESENWDTSDETWDTDSDETWDAGTDDADESWDSDDDGEWSAGEGWSEDAVEGGAFQYEDYGLYTRMVELSTGKEQRIYFFSKEAPSNGDPAQLPDGYVVDTNERTGLPYLRRSSEMPVDSNPVRDIVEEPEKLRCLAMTQSGARCKRTSVEDSDFCSVHADFTADEEVDGDPERCHAIKADGDQCKNHPREGSKYCASHKGWRGDKIDA